MIDHIVYTVFDLEEGIRYFADLLGVTPVFGGYHATRGTKNALLNLGNGCYLEILAIDENNTNVAPPRWMGIDLLEQPQVTRWCMATTQLVASQQVLQAYNPLLGDIQRGERTTPAGELLQWEMTLPLPSPQVEVIPFLIDWSRSATHPTNNLPQQCELQGLQLSHPQPARIAAVLNGLGFATQVRPNAVPQIQLSVLGAKGLVVI
ncbi:MAG: VOC family protein [Bacteroidetes bacterium]|nr:MAG: VOC family protein [Bacteroidota bacterium]PTM12720.1 MAG: VOC family protein [Bacteroidota bacterium]